MTISQNIKDLADFNYVVSMGLLTSNSFTGEFLNSFKCSIWNTGAPMRQFNVFFVKEKTSKPEKLLQKAKEFFGVRKLPFLVSFREGLEKDFLSPLEDKGYKEVRSSTVMTLMTLPETNPYGKDLNIQRVADAQGLADFQKVVEKSYGLGEGVGPFVITEAVLNLPDVELFTGYAGDRPACTSMLFKTGQAAGIYWVATLEEFRNRGFGRAITAQPLVAGKQRGCTFGCLQASDMGKPVYEKMGFDNPYNYRCFGLAD
ncbi:MAG: GNAT family N-acetyltransferase [Proteobacteria bacterium]|nr:GNAT family N-acetyltransferase [Pseudomonadota bacterium]MBU4470952.1 GNAT family N-acetyltransferase [Pseudomonadota bacterium]MCG2751439.1 GNAT family N-acetyltransferase [Desulfobacteraceae bacterium]